MLLGIHLTMLLGKTVPLPAELSLVESLESVEAQHHDEGASGFQMVFRAGRAGVADAVDYPLAIHPQLQPFNRVILTIAVNAIPQVLFDGVITNIELSPSNQPGQSTLTATGEDLSVMMDLEEKAEEHPAQPEAIIAAKIVAQYAKYGLFPQVIPPKLIDPPLPVDRVPVQRCTDLAYLRRMGKRYGHVFYVSPGPVPGVNKAYWGPPQRLSLPQPALTVNMGPHTNVKSIFFTKNPLAPELVDTEIQDSLTNRSMPVKTLVSTRIPPLASQPAFLFYQQHLRKSLGYAGEGGGFNFAQAYARAQGRTDLTGDQVLTARGELDAARYGRVLWPRSLVGVRGAGYQNDGLFYVKSVTHRIAKGRYDQGFTLTREGSGSITPVVPP